MTAQRVVQLSPHIQPLMCPDMVSPLSQKRHFCTEDMGEWYLQYFLVALARV
jgi:hypothetical protein